MSKKLIALTLCLCGFITGSFAANDSMNNFSRSREYQGFDDVDTDWWYASSIETAYEYGLVEGKLGGYGPNGFVTIAETIALACRLNSIYFTGYAEFENGTQAWYDTYVDFAVENNIINAGDYADYNAYATRLQYAKILNSSLPTDALQAINSIDDGIIPDVGSSIKDADCVYSLYRAGILTGNDETGVFAPFENILRSEVAAIVSRMADTSLRKNITLEFDYSNDEIFGNNNITDFGSMFKTSFDMSAKMNGGDVYFYDIADCQDVADNYILQLISDGFKLNSIKSIAGQDGAIAEEYQRGEQIVVLMYPTSYGFGVLIASSNSYYN